jgi:hypothetical protein
VTTQESRATASGNIGKCPDASLILPFRGPPTAYREILALVMHFLPGFGPHPVAEPPPPRRHAWWVALGLVTGVLVLGGLAGALLLGKAASDTVPRAEKTGHTIRYEVDGESAQITYRSAAGSSSRLGAIQLPWSKQMDVTAVGAPSIVAADRGSGYVACRLYVDGVLRASQESAGPDAGVSCSLVTAAGR